MTEHRRRHNSKDSTLKFVSRPDDITLDDDPNSQRLEMSCGHAVTPESLTAFCRSLLDQPLGNLFRIEGKLNEDKYNAILGENYLQDCKIAICRRQIDKKEDPDVKLIETYARNEGHYKFLCPAIKQGTDICGAEWPYMEVRRIALLTQEEQNHFEKKMAELAAAMYYEYNPCPRCSSYIERQDLTNLCVLCTICTSDTGEDYEFCWQCLKKWKGPRPQSDKCDNSNCVNISLAELLKCEDTNLPEVQDLICPSMRACPTCGNLIEHDRSGCKNIICNRCHIEFCFSCLKITEDCLETSSHFEPCSDGVAPRQTSIPTWRK